MLSSMSVDRRRTGVLLIQLGTPESPSVGDVRRYLREFLGDRRVLDLPRLPHWLLLHGVILPLRPRRSAAAYASIWTERGSPLLLHSRAFAEAVAKELGDGFAVELGMRYGAPSLREALGRLAQAEVDRVIALPLFPQHAESSTGSALARFLELAGGTWQRSQLSTIGAFFDHPGFIASTAALAQGPLREFRPDHVLFSYHGLPERQVRKGDASGSHCLESDACCSAIGAANRHCYRAQCFATTRALAAALELGSERHSISFQSRLGRTPWIRPYTDQVLAELASLGIRRLAVLCPSFVADCLETLEEIGIRAREQWTNAGGEGFLLLPSLNSEPRWVKAVADLVREHAQ
jgi:ferrochelatase